MTTLESLAANRVTRRRLVAATGAAAALGALGLQIGTSAAQDAVTVTMWGNHPEWKDAMIQILDAFMTQNPDVKIEFTGIPGPDYTTKLNTAIAGGAPPDTLGIEDGSIIKLATAGGEMPFVDLTGKIDISGLSGPARTQVEVDGKTYGTPLASYTVGLAYQKPIFEKHGITPPKTWDELKAAAKTLKDGGEMPFVLGAKDGVHSFFMYIGFVSSVLGPEGFEQLRTGERKLTDPDLLAAAQLLIDLKEFYQPGFEATDYTTAKAIFANGLGSMEVAGTADFAGFKQVNPDADLGFMAWPGPEAGKYSTNTGMELLYTVSATADAAKQEAATKLVNWLASVEAQQMVSDLIALPINTGVTESSDPVRQETVAARGLDVPVWYSVPETGLTFDTVMKIQGGLWNGRLTAEQFAEQVQAVIVPSAAAAATPAA